MPITSVTRNALRQGLVEQRHFWWGDLSEIDFLTRLYDLKAMPSTDSRFDDARADIVQHFIVNEDWDIDWIFTDARLGLDDDRALLRFLAETVHPEVRADRGAVEQLVAMYNAHLRYDEVELYPQSSISGRPVFGWRDADVPRLSDQELRELIADTIAEALKAYDVAEFCSSKLGLDGPYDEYDDPFRSKRAYVKERLKNKSSVELLIAAQIVHRELGGDELAAAIGMLEAQQGRTPLRAVRNLIFAADGPKPDIILRDSVSNDLEIVGSSEHCLIYDQPIEGGLLTWQTMVTWWSKSHPGDDDRAVALDLFARLLKSVTDAEAIILRAYAGLYRDYGFSIPALIPQVYLHYDPHTQRRRGDNPPLSRQRMDFLMLLGRHRRVVIELDGRQHYADDDGTASPGRYADMVAEDRRLHLTGYEVFRFGGAELVDRSKAGTLLRQFFEELLISHNVVLARRS